MKSIELLKFAERDVINWDSLESSPIMDRGTRSVLCSELSWETRTWSLAITSTPMKALWFS